MTVYEINSCGEVYKGTSKDIESPYSAFILNSGEPSATLKDFQISNAKTAIKAINQPRARIDSVKIQNADIGIDLTGNSGGSRLIDLDISAKDVCIKIDGSLDTVRIRGCQFWPFGMSVEDFMLSWSIKAGQCDNLVISESLFLNRGVEINGIGQFDFNVCQFDTWAKLHLNSSALVGINGGKFTCINSWEPCIYQYDGDLTVNGVRFWTEAFPVYYKGGTLSMNGCSYGIKKRKDCDGKWGF